MSSNLVLVLIIDLIADIQGFTRDEILRAMINSILNPSFVTKPEAMDVQKLQTSFDRLYGKTNQRSHRSFKELSGLKLTQFLEKHKDWFQLERRSPSKLFVKPKFKKRKANHSGDASAQQEALLLKAQLPDISDSVENDSFERRNPGKLSAVDFKPLSDNDDNQTDDHGEWVTVHKHKKDKTSAAVIKKLNVDESSEEQSLPSSMSFDLFRMIINENSSHVIKHRDESLYMKDKVKFMVDVVSLWNTPKRDKSYIVLGVDKQCEIGIKSLSNDRDYQNMFQSELFTSRPQFRYDELHFHGLTFGIVTVMKNKGVGPPCIVKYHPELRYPLKENFLFYREGRKNGHCKPDDQIYWEIVEWMRTGLQVSTTEFVNETCLSERNLLFFLKCVGNFQNGSFVLVANHCDNKTRYLQALALVPWILIFDFDIESKETGIYSICSDVLKDRRAVYTSPWATLPGNLSEHATTWCFVRGDNDQHNYIVDSDSRSWYTQVKHALNNYCQKLSKFALDYSVVNVVVLWNDGEQLLPHLRKLLSTLEQTLDPPPRIVVCMSSGTEPMNETVLAEIQTLKSDHDIEIINPLFPETLCRGIYNLFDTENKHTKINHKLPTSDRANDPNITPKDAAWLSEDFEILYLDSISVPQNYSLAKESENFLRGGVLSWGSRYHDQIDVQRDILESMLDTIRFNYLEHCKSGILTVYHAPGSGGTTFVQRVLWELHSQTPCMQLKVHTESTTSELVNKLTFVYDRTVSGYRPIIVMIDGDDDNIVRQIMKLKRVSILIIHVKRCNKRMQGVRNTEKTFWLKGIVTLKEAKSLHLKYDDRCDKDERKRKSLRQLVSGVESGNSHYMYEFGLVTYLHEFNGVKNFVKGYLDLHNNPVRNELLPWQKLLGYLSLVYYYGQVPVPCQMFTNLFGRPSNYAMSLNDFPDQALELIVSDNTDAKSNQIRVCHYLVAKEVLEQLLNKDHSIHPSDKDNPTTLGYHARHNLKKFAVDFIEFVQQRSVHSSPHSNIVTHILTKTFIYRDNSELGEISYRKKKPLLSALLTEIPSRPPFSERLEVLEKLIEASPKNPSFHAHLGRFYGYLRPTEEEKAEKALNTALSLCRKAEQCGEIGDRMGHTLKNIYHMYGMIYQRRIARYTGSYMGDNPEIKLKKTDNEENFKEAFFANLKRIVTLAKCACSHFENCRLYTIEGDEACYGYVGEMVVRLQICDYVSQNFPGGLDAYLESSTDAENTTFLKDCMAEIDELIIECYDAINVEGLDRSFHNAVFWYNTLFHGPHEAIIRSVGDDDMQSRRLKIAAMKIKYSGDQLKKVSTLDSVTSQRDIHKIVELLEENIEEAHYLGASYTKMHYDMDFKEWLYAIRHKQFQYNYKIEDVLSKVRQWYDDRRSPLSTFYLFVLNSLMGFGQNQRNVYNDNLIEAHNLIDDLQNAKYSAMKSRIPLEWLGKDDIDGIRRLVSGTQYRPSIQGRGYASTHCNDNSLIAICRGTICGPNKNRLSGYIEMDLKGAVKPVKVFFIPLKNDLVGVRHDSDRVEFKLSFTFGIGYEAFDVKPLLQFPCTNCKKRIEMTSREKCVLCSRCDTRNYKLSD